MRNTTWSSSMQRISGRRGLADESGMMVEVASSESIARLQLTTSPNLQRGCERAKLYSFEGIRSFDV